MYEGGSFSCFTGKKARFAAPVHDEDEKFHEKNNWNLETQQKRKFACRIHEKIVIKYQVRIFMSLLFAMEYKKNCDRNISKSCRFKTIFPRI